MVNSPVTLADHPDRGINCEMAAEQEFLALAERIGAAGWSGTEAAEALLSLALNYLRFREVSAEDEARISEARKKASH